MHFYRLRQTVSFCSESPLFRLLCCCRLSVRTPRPRLLSPSRRLFLSWNCSPWMPPSLPHPRFLLGRTIPRFRSVFQARFPLCFLLFRTAACRFLSPPAQFAVQIAFLSIPFRFPQALLSVPAGARASTQKIRLRGPLCSAGLQSNRILHRAHPVPPAARCPTHSCRCPAKVPAMHFLQAVSRWPLSKRTPRIPAPCCLHRCRNCLPGQASIPWFPGCSPGSKRPVRPIRQRSRSAPKAVPLSAGPSWLPKNPSSPIQNLPASPLPIPLPKFPACPAPPPAWSSPIRRMSIPESCALWPSRRFRSPCRSMSAPRPAQPASRSPRRRSRPGFRCVLPRQKFVPRSMPSGSQGS